jgi:rare lipoprotein A
MKFFLFLAIILVPALVPLQAQDTLNPASPKTKVLYGTASYYANKFSGRKTASGEIFSQQNLTAACNVLPLGTWIRVTNLRNGRTVIVKVNDRLHTKMKRVVDLSRSAAQKLGYLNSGLTRVKVEVLGKKKPENPVEIK